MNETDPQKLEAYLEQMEAYDGGLTPEVERLVEALHDWPQEARLQPRVGFVNEVAEQLHHHAARRRTMPTLPKRILAGALGAVALVVFGLIVIGLFSRGGDELPAAGMETPISAAETVVALEPTAITAPTDTPDAAQDALAEPPPGLLLAMENSAGGWGLWLVEEGGALRQLVEEIAAPTYLPDFHVSPDGRQVLYAYQGDIWRLDIASDTTENVTRTEERLEAAPRWLPGDGERFVAGSFPVAEAGPAAGYLTLIGFDGSYEVLDEGGAMGAPPAPSPDGQTIAYSKGLPFLYHLEGPERGSRPFTLAAFGLDWAEKAGEASWSPDGRLAWTLLGTLEESHQAVVVVFDLTENDHQVIHSYTPAGIGGMPSAPLWGSGGGWLVVSPLSFEPEAAGLWLADLAGETRKLTERPPRLTHTPNPALSLDGRRLAFSTGTSDAVGLLTVGEWEPLFWQPPHRVAAVGWVGTEAGNRAQAPATSTPVAVEEWSVYENDFLGYRFSYPPEARIRTLGVTGFPTEELPENRTAEEYRAQLEELYPDDLCVSVQYQTGFVTFVPSAETGGRYTGPCGVTGVGDYDITGVVETVLIDDITCTVTGWQLRERGESAAWHGEFYFLPVNDSITIHYGSMSGTQEQFLAAREALLQIVASFRSEQDLSCDAAGATGSSAPPDITLTLQDISTTRHETKVSLQIAIAGDRAGSVTGATLAQPALVDDQGNAYEPGVSSATVETTADGLLVALTQSFRPGALDAQALFLETGVELQAAAASPVTLDLRGRQPGDRWPVDQTIEIYGLTVPLVEAALVADAEGLLLQLVVSCASGDGAQLIQLQLLAQGETHQGDGYSRGCDGGRLVSARTLQGLLGDGSAPDEIESVILQPAGRLHLPGPWALRWEAGE